MKFAPVKRRYNIFAKIGRQVWVLGFFISCFCCADPLQVTITGNGQENGLDPTYFYEHLLILALEKTRLSDGDFMLLHNNHGGGIERDRAMVIAGVGIDVMWASVTRERVQKMRVIPVDLLRNLNNYRVLLINKDQQPLFYIALVSWVSNAIRAYFPYKKPLCL